jgi:metal transporter CNNM
VPVPVQWILIVFLVVMSAIFSGLTLGFLGLDLTGLEIIMHGDNVANAEAARKIYPIRKTGNRLLCTLVLGNVAVNSLLSILLADKAGGLLGFLISTFVIVTFGEIIPQAICSRYGLEIGGRLAPLVKVIMFLFCPITWPMAWCLDKTLGDELATTYSAAEMKKLLQIHVAEGRFDQETAEAMKGALAYKVS